MIIGVAKESDPAEMRSAMIPANVTRLVALGADVQIEADAGSRSGFSDEAFGAAGATIVRERQALLAAADMVLRVRKPPVPEVDLMKAGCVQVSFLDPFRETELVGRLAKRGISAVSLEMLPRITRAQTSPSMLQRPAVCRA